MNPAANNDQQQQKGIPGWLWFAAGVVVTTLLFLGARRLSSDRQMVSEQSGETPAETQALAFANTAEPTEASTVTNTPLPTSTVTKPTTVPSSTPTATPTATATLAPVVVLPTLTHSPDLQVQFVAVYWVDHDGTYYQIADGVRVRKNDYVFELNLPEGWRFSYEPHLMTIKWLPDGATVICRANAAQMQISPTLVLIQPGGEYIGNKWDLDNSVRRVRLVETSFALLDADGQLQHVTVPVNLDFELGSAQ